MIAELKPPAGAAGGGGTANIPDSLIEVAALCQVASHCAEASALTAGAAAAAEAEVSVAPPVAGGAGSVSAPNPPKKLGVKLGCDPFCACAAANAAWTVAGAALVVNDRANPSGPVLSG